MAGYGDTFSKMVGGYYKPDSKEAASAALFSASASSSSSSSANKVSPTDGSNKRSAVHVESVQVQAPQKRSKTQGGEGPLIL